MSIEYIMIFLLQSFMPRISKMVAIDLGVESFRVLRLKIQDSLSVVATHRVSNREQCRPKQGGSAVVCCIYKEKADQRHFARIRCELPSVRHSLLVTGLDCGDSVAAFIFCEISPGNGLRAHILFL